jgi:serine/threonine protein kinase
MPKGRNRKSRKATFKKSGTKTKRYRKRQYGGSPTPNSTPNSVNRTNSAPKKRRFFGSRKAARTPSRTPSNNNGVTRQSSVQRFINRIKRIKRRKDKWPPEREDDGPQTELTPPKINEIIKTSDVLGSGQFGEVSKAHSKCSPAFHDASLLLASKTLFGNASSVSEADFLREANILWTLQPHPNIVKMFGYQEPNNAKRIITELCNMGELRKWLINSKYKTSDLYSICLDIAYGMKHMHDNDIVHRDLAARNVLLASNDGHITAKVSDLGLAQKMDEEDNGIKQYRETTQVLMPVRWLHPISLESAVFNETTDVWSYGITVWEIFSKGITPYKDWNNTMVTERVSEGYRLPKPPACPILLYDTVKHCLDMNTKQPLTFARIVSILNDARKNSPLGDYLETGQEDVQISNDNSDGKKAQKVEPYAFIPKLARKSAQSSGKSNYSTPRPTKHKTPKPVHSQFYASSSISTSYTGKEKEKGNENDTYMRIIQNPQNSPVYDALPKGTGNSLNEHPSPTALYNPISLKAKNGTGKNGTGKNGTGKNRTGKNGTGKNRTSNTNRARNNVAFAKKKNGNNGPRITETKKNGNMVFTPV